MPATVILSYASRDIGLQNDDGSWGIEAAGEAPNVRYHATMVAAWVLRRLVARFYVCLPP